MAVAIKITGGQPMYRVIERLFPRTMDAKSYLVEMGVTLNSSQGKENGPKCFQHKGYTYILSHALPDIMGAEDDSELPDTDMVKDLKERNLSFKPAPSKDPTGAGKEAGFKKERPAASRSSNTINLKQLCQKLKLDPSKARQKLRKKFGAQGARYEWSPEEAAKIEEVLKA